ncbi:MAG TPA: pyrimidine-nucleoside phosphorylase [Bacteroidia bacterium]
MRITDIILKKRNGEKLSKEEIEFAVLNFASGKIPDYQFAAFLMAIYFQKLDKSETLALTRAMINSGNVIDLSGIKGVKVDKHSTGGVGDKTSLIVGPLVAAAGIKIAKLSGRGLGHTGGTIDKLESISGFSVEMTEQQFFKNVNEIGIAIGGQTSELVPADKKIYALRDVTCTVENISLIAGSIMSKKIASGADKIVLDVKVGDGAFMNAPEDAFALGKEMVEIGEGMGKETIAVITDMNQPLGNAIGNSLEVIEAIETLKGNGPDDLHTLCMEVSAHMMIVSGLVKNKVEAMARLEKSISSGAAFNKFRQWIAAQGGDVKQINDTSKLPASEFSGEVIATQDGFVHKIGARKIGLASVVLGAGRETKESKIDFGAGIYLHKKVGDPVKKGESLAKMYSGQKEKLSATKEMILSAYTILPGAPKKNPLIYGTVSKAGEVVYK